MLGGVMMGGYDGWGDVSGGDDGWGNFGWV